MSTVQTQEKIEMEALTGRTVCLVCSLCRCADDHPTQIKDSEFYTSQGARPTGTQLAPKHARLKLFCDVG